MRDDFLHFRMLLPFVPFLLIALAFLVILPGYREQRLLLALIIFPHLFVGTLLFGSSFVPHWRTASSADVRMPLFANSARHYLIRIDISIGLTEASIDLVTVEDNNFPLLAEHRQLRLDGTISINEQIREVKLAGASLPVLRVMEFLSWKGDGFDRAVQFSCAGWYSHAFIWASFSAWLLQFVCLLFVPHHFATCGILSGVFALISNWLYVHFAPIHFGIPLISPGGTTEQLRLHYGISFWICAIAGLLNLIPSLALLQLQLLRIYQLHTPIQMQRGEPKKRRKRILETSNWRNWSTYSNHSFHRRVNVAAFPA